METKLCRICGKLSLRNVHIFLTDGLRHKIETCLPIIVSEYSLLPDTICAECADHIDTFYAFTKICLQNIIILETQYDITESCLKTKRKHDKGCSVNFSAIETICKENASNLNFVERSANFARTLEISERLLNHKSSQNLVGYSDDSSENEDTQLPVPVKFSFNKSYFDDCEGENDWISEITLRKSFKRKANEILPTSRTKIFKMETKNRRKRKQPKKFDNLFKSSIKIDSNGMEDHTEKMFDKREFDFDLDYISALPEVCLLCDAQFSGATSLAAHVYETHGIDMAQVISSEPVPEKKKLPDLVKNTHRSDHEELNDINTITQPLPLSPQSFIQHNPNPLLDPPLYDITSTYNCPQCSATLTTRTDLFSHLRLKHASIASLTCGLCLAVYDTYVNLHGHLETCTTNTNIGATNNGTNSSLNTVSSSNTRRFKCKICHYSDSCGQLLEAHVPVHEFLLTYCKEAWKIFDPADYVEVADDFSEEPSDKPVVPMFTCDDCEEGETGREFDSFREYSTHRRAQHQIFHCDLCNKCYGRNSHLWKHVNRLHKGHPAITCQLCYKTSASKYHLAQHFNKIHITKPSKHHHQLTTLVSTVDPPLSATDDFLSRKFEPFDFQSVKQSFLRQELLDLIKTEPVVNANQSTSDEELENLAKMDNGNNAVKELDNTSNQYTNIITNYSPKLESNSGAFKCSKCDKGFHKRHLLKKHRKNCRPRSQKDLLTRCKTCARIFKDRQSLAKHLINYHSTYTCEICRETVESKCEIVSHIRFSHPNCDLFCHCGNILRTHEELRVHKANHNCSHVCQFCGDVLDSKIKLKMHVLSLHRKILSLSCGICLKLFETQQILRDHVRFTHVRELNPITSCTVCGKMYGSKWKTYDHLNKSHGRIFRACRTCLEVFDTEGELQLHCDEMHGVVAGKVIKNTSQPPKKDPAGVVKEPEDKAESTCSELSEVEDEDPHNKNIDIDNDELDEETDDEELVTTAMVDSNSKNFENVEKSSYNFLESVGEKRISLLEKRLLGRNVLENDFDQFQSELMARFGNGLQQREEEAEVVEEDDGKVVGEERINGEIAEGDGEELVEREEEENGVSSEECPEKPEIERKPTTTTHSSQPNKRTVYVNSDSPSSCQICEKTWPAKKHLWQHYIRCHKTLAATVCGICLRTHSNYAQLQRHLHAAHPNLLHGQGFGSNFICRICGRYHNASSKLRLHMVIHERFDWALLNEKVDDRKMRDVGGKIDDDGKIDDIVKIEKDDGKMEDYDEKIDEDDEKIDEDVANIEEDNGKMEDYDEKIDDDDDKMDDDPDGKMEDYDNKMEDDVDEKIDDDEHVEENENDLIDDCNGVELDDESESVVDNRREESVEDTTKIGLEEGNDERDVEGEGSSSASSSSSEESEVDEKEEDDDEEEEDDEEVDDVDLQTENLKQPDIYDSSSNNTTSDDENTSTHSSQPLSKTTTTTTSSLTPTITCPSNLITNDSSQSTTDDTSPPPAVTSSCSSTYRGSSRSSSLEKTDDVIKAAVQSIDNVSDACEEEGEEEDSGSEVKVELVHDDYVFETVLSGRSGTTTATATLVGLNSHELQSAVDSIL